MSQRARNISVMILKTKFLPVTNGKNKDGVMIRETNGTKNMPPNRPYLINLLASIFRKYTFKNTLALETNHKIN